MTFHLPNLPYAKDALAPHISEQTLEFHYGKHHAGYVNKLNELVKGTRFENKSLEEIIQLTKGDGSGEPSLKAFFNNAAQIMHHTFFWESLAPKGGGALKDGPLKNAVLKAFDSEEQFKKAFHQAACGQFGSGWVWLTLGAEGTLAIESTSNATFPKGKALLTCDVWEHAYYLDYQNKRPDYVTTFLNHLANWSFAEDRLRAALN